MTREEEIRQASIEWKKVNNPVCVCGDIIDRLNVYYEFIEGAKWADKHPKDPWISVKDKLPSEGIQVLTINQKGLVALSYYKDGLWWQTRCVRWDTTTGGRTKIEWIDMNTDITHWMPTPEQPKQ